MSIAVLETSARQVAARVLREPVLYSVLVDLRDSRTPQPIDEVRFGYQQHRKSLIFGETLKVCWVDVKPDPLSATLGSSGTYRREQFSQLASIQGLEFPPSRLQLDALQLEPSDVLRIVENRPVGTGAELGNIALSLFNHEGRLAWRVLQEIDALGARTLFLDARDGRVLYEGSSPSPDE